MNDNERKLTPKQKKAIAALFTEPTILAAADKIHVNPGTIHRWLDEPDFQAALKEAESQAVDAAARKLASLSEQAGKVIEDLLYSPKAAPGIRLRAAISVFDWIIKLRTYNDLETEILALNQKLDEIKNLKQSSG